MYVTLHLNHYKVSPLYLKAPSIELFFVCLKNSTADHMQTFEWKTFHA